MKHIPSIPEKNKTLPPHENGIYLSDFYISTEWDIMTVPAIRHEKFYSCCEEPYPDIYFYITIRRKTLYYVVNLIIPCVGISFLTVLVFYLPSDSGEKVSMCISILLSLTVFFLLLAEIIPPTSLSVPLLGKYLLFTMILISFSVLATVFVLNVNFRTPATHKMSPWVKTIFLEVLPKVLCMSRPSSEDDEEEDEDELMEPPEIVEPRKRFSGEFSFPGGLPNAVSHLDTDQQQLSCYKLSPDDDMYRQEFEDMSPVDDPREELMIKRGIENVQFIAQHMKNEDKYGTVSRHIYHSH